MKCCHFFQILIESVTFIVFSQWYKSNPLWKENGDANEPDFKITEQKSSFMLWTVAYVPLVTVMFKVL